MVLGHHMYSTTLQTNSSTKMLNNFTIICQLVGIISEYQHLLYIKMLCFPGTDSQD